MSRMLQLLTAAEIVAVRANAGIEGGDGGRRAKRTVRAGSMVRITGGNRYNVLRVVPGFRREGDVATRPHDHTEHSAHYRSLTLPREPTCRGCGGRIEAGQPVVRFDFWPSERTMYPRTSMLHGDACPGEPS